MRKSDSFNYSDITPDTIRDLNFFNEMDQEEFDLLGVAINYYKLKSVQPNFDPVFRDYFSSPDYEEPIQIRGMFKADELTAHGMSDIGIGQIAERNGKLQFNISKLEYDIGREPILGDVVEYIQAHQKFIIQSISKSLPRLGRTIRYTCEIKLYQDSK